MTTTPNDLYGLWNEGEELPPYTTSARVAEVDAPEIDNPQDETHAFREEIRLELRRIRRDIVEQTMTTIACFIFGYSLILRNQRRISQYTYRGDVWENTRPLWW